jgi:hypothetical protein
MKKLTTHEYVEKAKQVHGELYDYSLVEYITAKVKIKVICNVHGIFEITPDKHLQNRGCSRCKYEKLHNLYRSNVEEFTQKSNVIHNKLYDYSKFIYVNCHTKGIIICSKHGEFNQKPSHHLDGVGCPRCNTSKGELKIEKWLSDNNIIYTTQHKFDDCKNKRCLPFDFYLTDCNTCIEFDGEQHFNLSRRSKSPEKNLHIFNTVKLHDGIKNSYCINNNIKLLRIPYTKYNDIDTILSREFI